ncbi:MAG: threonylcarbamoyl-AMP synthase [Marinilabiliales bacterium]|nr:MAG: threonylcarbamoyl-AMP synthase [Marinilabiliales bacterium]
MSFDKEIQKSVELLKKGKVILYPTDTIWGIGCDATNSKSVQKIYKIKGRTESKTMILLLDAVENLHKYVNKVPDITPELISQSDKPLTIVYKGAKNISKTLIASDGTIAIRIVQDDFCRELIEKLGKPLVSTSANISGQPSAKYFNEISDEIKENVDYVVNLHQDKIGVKASTIIKLEDNGTFEVLRP